MKSLVLLLCLSSVNVLAAYPIVSGRSPAQRADTIYEMVGKELIYIEKTPDKFKSIRAATEDLRKLARSEETTPEMLAHIQTYISALESLPEKKGFHKGDCADYAVDEKAKPLLDGLCQ